MTDYFHELSSIDSNKDIADYVTRVEGGDQFAD